MDDQNLTFHVCKSARRLETFLLFCLRVLVVVIVGVTFTQVIFRYVLSNPLVWTSEVARISFVWLVFLGIPILSLRGHHIGISLFNNKMPFAARVMIERLWAFTGVVLYSLFLYYGVVMMQIVAQKSTPALGMPAGILYLSCLFGGAFGAFLSLTRLFAKLETIKPQEK
jgi:TRAP-type C4-dicarboxylate transport system permease small subunit